MLNTNSIKENSVHSSDFLQKTSLGLAVVSLLFLTPFAINNFISGRNLLGFGASTILAALSYNIWSIVKRGHYHHFVTLLIFVPSLIFFLSVSIHNQGIIGGLWCFPSLISFYFMLPERKAWLANVTLLLAIIPQIFAHFEMGLAIRISVTLFLTSVFVAIFIKVITDLQNELQKRATTDPLTGVLNRTLLQDTLEQAINVNRRKKLPMTLINLDLDHFKAVNDTFGHDAGDTVLHGVSSYLRKRLRHIDKIFRVGGEEFLVLFYGTDLENSLEVAEELRSTIAMLPLLPRHPVTTSIGVAALQTDENWKDWIKRSDKNVYQAKLNGRNRIIS